MITRLLNNSLVNWLLDPLTEWVSAALHIHAWFYCQGDWPNWLWVEEVGWRLVYMEQEAEAAA